MAQDTIDRCLGLVSQYNSLSLAKGALIQADNCVIRRENIVEDRRGYAVYATLSNSISKFLKYSGKVIAHNLSTLSYDNGSGTFSDFNGSYSAPSGSKMRFVEASSNLYVTTSLGPKAVTSLSTAAGTIRATGSPRPLDPSYVLNAAASGFLADTNNCAYRVVIRRTDANGNVIRGCPSTRMFVYNGSESSKNVDITIYLPAEVTTSDVIEIYRTVSTGTGATDTAGDDMALVYEASPTSGQLSGGSPGYFSFTDVTVDALRGANLYTNSAEEGIGQENDRPPLCKDLAVYKNFMMFGNTSTKQRLYLTLVGTSGLNSKSITLSGLAYTFSTTPGSENASTRTVEVSASGIAAVAIDETARSLVRVINRASSNTSVYAYYLSGPDDLPGQVLIEERGVGASAFTVQASDSTISGMFSPPPPVGSTNAASTSTNDVRKNGLFYSKTQQFEHVPALNYVLVGAANDDILRIIALRDSLVIIKQNGGVYRLTGETVPFYVQPLDLTVICKSANSIAVLANSVFMLSNQGIVRITDTGVEVISRDIEPEILPLLTYSGLNDYTCGYGYESDHTYMLSTMKESTDTAPTQTFVYNTFTRAWTRYTFGFTDALVEDSVDKLFFAKSGDSVVYRERKSFSDADYADPESSITLTAISGKSVTFTTSGGLVPLEGWVIKQGDTGVAIKSIVFSSGGYVVTLADGAPSSWATGAATLFPSVGMVVKWAPWTGGSLNAIKQVRAAQVVADPIQGRSSATEIVATFETNLDPNTEEVSVESRAAAWGGPWGEFAWGGVGGSGFPTWLPRQKQYCHLLIPGIRHQRANEKASIAALGFTFEVSSDVVGR